jgi:hypothetical protein
VTGQWFSQGTLVNSTNKTDHHNLTEILLKMALSTINQIKPHSWKSKCKYKTISKYYLLYSSENKKKYDKNNKDYEHTIMRFPVTKVYT